MTISSPTSQTQYIDAPGQGIEALETMSQVEPVESELDITLGEEDGVQEEIDEESVEEGSQEASEEEVVGEAKEEVSKESSSEEAKSEPIKVVSAFLGDKKFDVPENAVFKVKVDGKELEVTLPELQKNYQGKIPWERHYHESKQRAAQLDARESELTAKETSAQAKLDKVMETFEKNPYLAFDMIAKMKGKNPADYLPIYIAQSKKTMEELETLTEAQLQALMIQKRVAYDSEQLKEKEAALESKTKAIDKTQEVQNAESWFSQEIQANGFTQEELTMAQDILKEHKNLPNMSPQQIAEQMKAYILQVERPFALVESAAAAVDPSLVSNRELISHVKGMIDSSFTKEDVTLILREYLKDSSLKPSPTATASSVGTNSAGSESEAKPAKPTKVAQPSVAPKVSGNSDVGPMSIWDLVSEYN